MAFSKFIKPLIFMAAIIAVTYSGVFYALQMLHAKQENQIQHAREEGKALEAKGKDLFKSINALPEPLPDSAYFKAWTTDSKNTNLSFFDLDGRKIKLSDYRGRYVLLNVWATWCTPCLKELPSLNNLNATLDANKWSVLAVAEDYMADPEKIRSFAEKLDVKKTAGFYFGKDSRASKFLTFDGVLPTTFIINPDGYLILQIKGDAEWHSKPIVDFLEILTK